MQNNYLLILFIILLLNYVLFLLKIFNGLNKLARSDKPTSIKKNISVIIPFRNESENILNSLKSIEKQNYPKDKYEVIYIDDNSSDDSLEKLSSAQKSSNIKILCLNNEEGLRAYKKRAVAFGIENATGDIVVTTDADCTHHENWLSTIVSTFDENTAMIAGPVDYKKSEILLNNIQRLEFQGLMLAGAGLIGSRTPVICSAANLAYKKHIFYEVNGFSDQLNLSSGDDELLMQKMHRTGKYKIQFCANPDTMVSTNPSKNLDEFFNQRSRWASKGLFYADKFLVFRLILIFFFYVSFPVLITLSFFSQVYFFLLVAFIGGKLLPEYLVMRRGINLIFKTGSLKYFLVAEIFQIFYIIIAAISGLRGNLNWKGRIVKR